MEGAHGEVICCVRGVSFLLLFLTSAGAYGRSTYLIIEHPQALVIYNRYQQPASPGELAILKSFGPVLVLQENGFLGDGISPCMTVQIEGVSLYFGKEKDGNLTNSEQAGFLKFYRGCTPLNDSVAIQKGNLRITSVTGKASRLLKAGEHSARFFSHASGIYGAVAEGSVRFGWISPGTEGRDWKVLTKEVVSSPIRSDVADRIAARISEANNVLLHVYDFLNKETSLKRIAPQWVMESAPGSITIDLRETGNPWTFQQSTTHLATNIENLVLGTGWGVVQTAGHIELRKK